MSARAVATTQIIIAAIASATRIGAPECSQSRSTMRRLMIVSRSSRTLVELERARSSWRFRLHVHFPAEEPPVVHVGNGFGLLLRDGPCHQHDVARCLRPADKAGALEAPGETGIAEI